MNPYADPSQRDSLYYEEAKIISHQAYEGEQFILRIQTENAAKQTQAGQFIHIQCAPQLLMRRPISVMRTNPQTGTMDLLYKVVGEGTKQLSQRQVSEIVSIIAPIGKPFDLNAKKPLLIGGGVGMPPMIMLAEAFKNKGIKPMVILGSEVPFPFQTAPSQMMIKGMPNEVIASMPLLDDWNVPCRLTSLQNYSGCFQGYVTDLARLWINAIDEKTRQEIVIYSCGPHPMLQAVHQLALDFDLPCQVSLEEYMACGIGGCAGCVVEVTENNDINMKRVCVDGPVFDSRTIF